MVGANSSVMFGARTASETVARKAIESTGAQMRLDFQVTVWPIVE